MISPTPRAIFLMFSGVPIFIGVGVIVPGLWYAAFGWMIFILGLVFIDMVLGARLDALDVQTDPPTQLYIDGKDTVRIEFRFREGSLPRSIDVRLETNPLIKAPDTQRVSEIFRDGSICQIDLIPKRRGNGQLTNLWLRWTGAIGLAHKQKKYALAKDIPIIPNIKWVRDEAVRLYTRDADYGIKKQLDRGDGSEFDALREFTTGMDRRAIDWKHSARHQTLLAKEFRTERNHNIVFAFDTGRLMSEPLNGIPKIDRAINAGLLLAFVSLRSGDKTALFGFDAQPHVTSSLMTGRGAFNHVQQLASRLDYSTEEANYTLALSELAGRLERRSLIILFTDFVDTISAELMLETVRRLTQRHLVLFATFEDSALRNFVDQYPDEGEDVSRAVIASTLLKERDLVFRRLGRLGAHVLETRPENFGSDLVTSYLDIKRRELL